MIITKRVNPTAAVYTPTIMDFRQKVHRLWSEHVNYTRNAIISIVAGLDDLPFVIDRLLKNQEEIGQILAPYYGKTAADELTRLLKEHIDMAGKIVTAAKTDQPTTELIIAWENNAKEIATFLSTLDSKYWPKEAVLSLLQKHLQCTLDEASARITKNWAADFKAYEDCSVEIMGLAQAMANGIVNKFFI